MIARRTFLLACAALVAGCDLVPEYLRPTTAAPPATFKEEPGWRVAAPADDIARGEWWRLFEDPILDDLQQRVIVSNQTLAAAKAAYDQARALVREQRAAYLPTVNLSAGGSMTENPSTTSTSRTTTTTARSSGAYTVAYNATLGATWEPDLWGRIGATAGQAGALAEASRADLLAATLSAQGELALNYVQLRGLESQKAIYADTITAYERALTIVQNRYNAGTAQRSDVLQAETALHNARANASDLDRQRAQLEHAIAVLAGENPSTFSLHEAVATPTIPAIPSILPGELLERRPDVAAAERRVAAANANVGIQRAAYFPVVDLTGDLASSAQRVGRLFDAASTLWSLGVSGAVTLLDFGATAARVEQARAAYAQTVANYRGAVLVAFQQTEDQLAAIRVLANVAEFRIAAARAANQAEAIARNQYLAGQIGYADVIVVQTTALSARLAEAQSITDRQSAAISLIQAIGGHWRDEALQTAP
jgi:NodT family efflux transporter outer membrane factor (OMF) lipoprotein